MSFFGESLGLELAHLVPDRKVAFYWLGGRGHSMIGLWEAGTGPQVMRLHVAFRIDLADLLDAPSHLRAAGIVPLDFWDRPTEEPVVFGWMPAASVFFHDPDGHLLEFLTMLPEPASPEVGIVPWSHWRSRRHNRT